MTATAVCAQPANDRSWELQRMGGWAAVINVVLATAAVAFLLWGVRQWTLLRRLHRGLAALREDRTDFRVRRDPADSESVLKAFDHLAQELALRKRESTATGAGGLKAALAGLCEALRPPLLTIQGYASLMAQEPVAAAQGDYLRNLLAQVNGLVNLLESSENVSELRKRLSGLQRSIPALEPGATSATVLLVDEEGPFAEDLTHRLGEIGWKLLVAPGAMAAAVMTRAIGPRVVLANAARPDGLGWKAIGQVLRIRAVDCVGWLFSCDSQRQIDRLWAPSAILLWPVANNGATRIVQRWRNEQQRQPVGVAGDEELATAVAQWLTQHAVATTASAGAGWRLAHCCTLELPAEASSAQEAESVLVIPSAAVDEHPGLLADAFATSTPPARTDGMADPCLELVERLRALAAAASSGDPIPAKS